ncbi:TIGR02450 family Trp-rich protein [Pantanalinema rosaneae CENA516]|uniref:TIGR02450 family Trp-rich protein n=1 Tax=Pantanalinema rosaneae TaxID=1620701 RepID=UPI003D6F52AF
MPRKQKFPHLLSSKWTAHQKIDGWRHFQVVNRKNQGQWVFAELVAACDPTVRFWINAKLLKDKHLWQAGWRSLQEVESPALELDELSLPETQRSAMSRFDR